MPKKPQEPKTVRTYEMRGGGTISGSTPRELAVALRNSSFTPMNSLREFVEDVAKRCRFYDRRTKVRPAPLRAFIEDLIRWEFLTPHQPHPPNVIAFPDDPEALLPEEDR